MSEAAEEPMVDTVLFKHTLLVDAQFAGRMTRASFRAILLTPARVITYAAIVLLFSIIGATSLGSDSASSSFPGLAIMGALSALYVLIFVIAYFQSLRQLRQRLPMGSEYAMALSDSALTLKDPLATVSLSFALYKSIRVYKDVVALIPRRGSRPTIVPREMFTDESLTWLKVRIGTA